MLTYAKPAGAAADLNAWFCRSENALEQAAGRIIRLS
jgi:hypothetical protein